MTGTQRITRPTLAMLAVFAVVPGSLHAQRRPTFEIDNDAFNVQSVGRLKAHFVGAPSDEEYTHGMRVHLPQRGPSPLSGLLRLPSLVCDADAQLNHDTRCHSWRVVLSQAIYTPRLRPSASVPIAERAFAGWLGMILATDLRTAAGTYTFDVTVGIVGRPSMAGPSQTLLHRLIGSLSPQGWGDQLKTEPTFAVAYHGERQLYDERLGRHATVLIAPTWALSAGTTRSAAQTGVIGVVELGAQGLSHWRDRSPHGSGLFVIGRAAASVVANDLFLDGGFFRDAPGVGHRSVVTTTEMGFGIVAHGRGVEWRFSRNSREYATQPRPHAFVTVALIR